MISDEYLAGFFDGEGCINITVRGKARQTVLRLWLTNTDYEFLSEIQKQYGGKLVRRQQKNIKWKDCCNIVWQGGSAATLLRRIGPRLILKARQARVALAFVDFCELPIGDRCTLERSPCLEMPNRTIRRRTEHTIHRERKFKNCLHTLNRKGAIALSEAGKSKK